MKAYVTNLHLKPEHGMPMTAPPDGCLRLTGGTGIDGDANADPVSPRQVLLATQETLALFGLTPGDLRENIVTHGLALEALPSGTILQIGGKARIRLTFPCEVCSRLTAVRPSDRKRLEGKRGVLGVVVAGGPVAKGDDVICLPSMENTIPAAASERFAWIVRRIPQGKVLDYRQMLRTLGASQSYLRAFPRYLQQAASIAPAHRVVDSQRRLPPYIPNQRQLLAAEGIIVLNDVVPERFLWDAAGVYSEGSCLECR